MVQRHMDQTNLQLAAILSHIGHNPLPHLVPTAAPSSLTADLTTTPAQPKSSLGGPSVLPQPPPVVPANPQALASTPNHLSTLVPPAPSTPSERSIILGDGTIIQFTQADVPDPPAVSFTSNIPRLNRMWDDTSTHWDGNSALSIQGHSIALVHWPGIYRYWKQDQWKGTKAKWFEWKVCCFVPDLCLSS